MQKASGQINAHSWLNSRVLCGRTVLLHTKQTQKHGRALQKFWEVEIFPGTEVLNFGRRVRPGKHRPQNGFLPCQPGYSALNLEEDAELVS